MERIQSLIVGMVPLTDAQRWLQSRALEFCGELLEERWQALEQKQLSLPTAFLGRAAALARGALCIDRPAGRAQQYRLRRVVRLRALDIGSRIPRARDERADGGLIHVSQKPLLKALDHLGN
jgi:hypothetical protein